MVRRFDGKPDPADDSVPPLVEDFLAEQIEMVSEEASRRRMKWPDEIPPDSHAAARWWMTMQKPANDKDERPRQVTVVGGGNRWECAYHLRISATFRMYASLPDFHRETIRAALEDGIWWNGDKVFERDGSPGIFLTMIEETHKMNHDPQKYIAQTRARTGALIRRTRENHRS